MSEFGGSLRRLFTVFAAAALLYVAGHAVLAQSSLSERLKTKGARVEAGIKSFGARGGDPSAILAVIQQVKPRLNAGDPGGAEALLDRALAMLADGEKALSPAGDGPSLPVFSGTEEPSDLFDHPEPVVISGYHGSAMEPFISPDGRYLFFNNENDPKVNTNLFFAQRVDGVRFRFLGELPGVNSPGLDAVASLDASGHLLHHRTRLPAHSQFDLHR